MKKLKTELLKNIDLIIIELLKDNKIVIDYDLKNNVLKIKKLTIKGLAKNEIK